MLAPELCVSLGLPSLFSLDSSTFHKGVCLVSDTFEVFSRCWWPGQEPTDPFNNVSVFKEARTWLSSAEKEGLHLSRLGGRCHFPHVSEVGSLQ